MKRLLRRLLNTARAMLAQRRIARGGAVRTRNTVMLTQPVGADSTTVILSPGRSTVRRPGETHAEAMERLVEGEDL